MMDLDIGHLCMATGKGVLIAFLCFGNWVGEKVKVMRTFQLRFGKKEGKCD